MIYDEQSIREDYKNLTNLLIERGLTITTMESATSGQIASLITDTEGASAVLKGALITYSNEAKIKHGVPEEVIEKYSVYSTETAEAMAKAVCEMYPSDIAIGVTGTMGNIDPNNPKDSVPGHLYYAILIHNRMRSYHVVLEPQKSRLLYKLAAAKEICDCLMGLPGLH